MDSMFYIVRILYKNHNSPSLNHVLKFAMFMLINELSFILYFHNPIEKEHFWVKCIVNNSSHTLVQLIWQFVSKLLAFNGTISLPGVSELITTVVRSRWAIMHPPVKHNIWHEKAFLLKTSEFISLGKTQPSSSRSKNELLYMPPCPKYLWTFAGMSTRPIKLVGLAESYCPSFTHPDCLRDALHL